MAIVGSSNAEKTVADPNLSYLSLAPLWQRSRAVCNGERFVKDVDSLIDVNAFKNLLIPFSPSMSQKQYNFYKAEAELPGIVSQFSKMLVGGLLRKQPILKLPDDLPDDAHDWIMNKFGRDDSSLVSFLDEGIWEEIQTSREWIYVDYPKVDNPDEKTENEIEGLTPFPVLWSAESVINWKLGKDKKGKTILTQVIYRGFVERYDDKHEFHPKLIDTIWVHELDESGYYQIRIFEEKDVTQDAVTMGGRTQNKVNKKVFEETEVITNILMHGNRIESLPIWPLNGRLEPQEPLLTALSDKEVALYNKMSRRNHLLYGAATYTPIIASDMTDDAFADIVNSGLGTWIKLNQGDNAFVLDTPTAALQDMDRAIASAIEEMAKLGIRMLTPETAQSGVALELRNAAQTAQLGTLSTKISNTIRKVITFMINWQYDKDYDDNDIEFILSEDFNPIPLGADWLRLATEWYEKGLIPRSIWLQLIKQNDMIPPEYDDEEGVQEINGDELLVPKGNEDYANTLEE